VQITAAADTGEAVAESREDDNERGISVHVLGLPTRRCSLRGSVSARFLPGGRPGGVTIRVYNLGESSAVNVPFVLLDGVSGTPLVSAFTIP